MLRPPLHAGAVNDTDIAEQLVADADTDVGIPGTVGLNPAKPKPFIEAAPLVLMSGIYHLLELSL